MFFTGTPPQIVIYSVFTTGGKYKYISYKKTFLCVKKKDLNSPKTTVYLGIQMGLGKKFFSELKTRCNLGEKQIMILKSLRNSDMSAKKISSKTGIPLGRLYEYLNELLYDGLIEKKGKKPCVYSIDNMEDKVRNFMKKRFDKVVSDEKSILATLNRKEENDYTEITNSKEEFVYTQLKMLSACKKLYTLTRYESIPFLIYPTNHSRFTRFRKAVMKARPTLASSSEGTSMLINKAYIDAYKNGKSLTAIVSKKSFDFHFELAKKELGEDFLKEMVEDIKKKIKEHDIKIYLLDEFFPMQIFINEDTVYISIVHKGATYGNIIYSKEASQLYTNMYEGMLERCIPLESYLKKILVKA
ncbi:helix-turn-helix domain-containing protein [candidate division KSB1 bacterium]